MSGFTSKWRLWFEDDQAELRVCRDRGPSFEQARPEHLEAIGDGRIAWRPHRQGDSVPAIPRSAFAAWLDQGGS